MRNRASLPRVPGADDIYPLVLLLVYFELRAALARHGVAPRRQDDPKP